jgi:hypothetical protein
MSPIDPGLEKTLHKKIKKFGGEKLDVIAAYIGSITTSIGGRTDIAINAMIALTEHDIWFIQDESAQRMPLKNLVPKFPKPDNLKSLGVKIFAIFESLEFTFLPTGDWICIRPIESTDQYREFLGWLQMLVERDKLQWWL